MLRGRIIPSHSAFGERIIGYNKFNPIREIMSKAGSIEAVIGQHITADAVGVDRVPLINRVAMYREQFYWSFSNFDTFLKGVVETK